MPADRPIDHPLFARFYERGSQRMERAGMADLRRRLLHGISGQVVEVGAGNGLNFAHYPSEVARVVAVEPERHLREHARRRAAEAPVHVEVLDGVAERIPADEHRFDVAVVSLVLCSVSDPAAAARELRRVLRPGGEVRFLEHVRAQSTGLARVQRFVDTTFWPRVGAGCHTHRDPVATFEAAGFRIEGLTRLRFPDARPPMPTSPHVIATAVLPHRAD